MKRKYTFIKIRIPETENCKELVYPNWFFVANDVIDIIQHTDKFLNSQVEEAVLDIIEEKKGTRHFITNLGWSANEIAKLKGGSPIYDALPSLMQQILEGKIKLLDKGIKPLIRDNGTYMGLIDSYEITETKVMDKLSYPAYSVEDIKIIRWPNGKHYYAKIGNIDVVDKYGKCKWNTSAMAQKKAEEFVKTLN